MGWSKPFDEIEIAYIKESWPRLSSEEIGRKLGRSKRGVNKVISRLGLRERCVPTRAPEEDARATEGAPPAAPPPMPAPGEAEQDELAELREIKRVLKRTLRDDISPKDMPKLSAELREVIRRISELEGGADGDGGTMAGGAGSIVFSVPLRPA